MCMQGWEGITSSCCRGGVMWGTQGIVSDAALRSPCQRWMTGECLKRMRAGPLQAEEKPSLATGNERCSLGLWRLGSSSDCQEDAHWMASLGWSMSFQEKLSLCLRNQDENRRMEGNTQGWPCATHGRMCAYTEKQCVHVYLCVYVLCICILACVRVYVHTSVSKCMHHVYLCVYMYVLLCVYLYVCVSMYVTVCTCVYLCVPVCICTSEYVFTCMCMYVCAHMCTYVYVSTCVYKYTCVYRYTCGQLHLLFLRLFPLCLFETRSLSCVELDNSALLIGQRAPGICLSLLPQC